MIYEFIIDDAALEQLRALPKEVRRNIGYRLEMLQDSFQGDVKKLEGEERRYRLRVGNHRVLFRLDGKIIHVYAVKQRKEAYG
ncbi:MAG: type II toxin-antitoxin system RelE/ParE family toxin [Acidobacteriia bacterium]|nr:type II toxin-antitoxin system RelE/ParE family toxin [Terriglobia bacterium]